MAAGMSPEEMTRRFGDEVFGAAVPDIKADSVVLDIAMHPLQDVCAFGSIAGTVELWKYGRAPVQVASKSLFKDSCRSLSFSADGNRLFAAGKDGSIVALDATGAEAARIPDAHSSPITRSLHFASVMLATGDEDGTVAVWDMRVSKPVMRFEGGARKRHLTDSVSAFAFSASPGPTLLATSTDGTLGVVNLRTARVTDRSDQLEDEHLSVAIMKGGRKVVTGTLEGGLCIFSWGKWGNMDDRYPGLPDSIERLVPVDGDCLLAGCGDGSVRLLQVQPNRDVLTLAELGDNSIEAMVPSRDGTLLALSAQDNIVTFVDTSSLAETAAAASPGAGAAAAAGGSRARAAAAAGSDDDDDDEDDDDMDSDEGDDGLVGAAARAAAAAKAAGRPLRGVSRGAAAGMGGSDFFSDM